MKKETKTKAKSPATTQDPIVEVVDTIPDLVPEVENTELDLRRELLVLAYQSIKEGSERQVILNYQNINSELSNDLFFAQLHKDLKTGEGKGTLFGLCKAKNVSI